MKKETTTKRILLLPIIIASILLLGIMILRSSPSQENAASSAIHLKQTSHPIPKTVNWETPTTTTTPPPPVTVGKRTTPKPERAPQQRVSRSQGAGCTTGSANPYAPNANCSGCESRNVQQFNPSGKYWGKYQFDRQTWAKHGGNPSEYGNASEAEQDRVAANVKYDAWPNC